MGKKFWEINNYASTGAEIKLYGPITSGHSWFDGGDTVTANDFASDLEALAGKDVQKNHHAGQRADYDP